jgi:soluble lytic murein transglycosylase-like protein
MQSTRVASDVLRSPSARCARIALAALVLFSMSCAITPAAAPRAPLAASLAEKPAPNDPSVAAVRARLVRYQASTGLTDAEMTRLAETIVVEARRYHFDPSLVLAVIHVESRFDTYAVSPKDALGLMQLLPSTGEELAPIVGVEWHGPQTLFDPVANVRLGVAYLRQLTDRYNGSVRTALVAYNWGPGRIDQFVRAGDPLPREYSQLVLAAYDRS